MLRSNAYGAESPLWFSAPHLFVIIFYVAFFQKKIENFTCGDCGAKVKGNGYTNHCPVCLWSKHVDVNPGDRQNICGGMMRPVAVEFDHGEYMIVL